MTALAERLRARIAAEGPIPVAAFVEAALRDAEHGYYRRRDAIGAAGDFITAPEISQVFGELLGAWAAAVWQAMGSPAPVRLVELGPGRGTLMADALRATRGLPGFHAALEPHLVEIDAALRARQAAALAAFAPRWHEAFDAVPEGPLIVLANEFFDALPVRQYVMADDGPHERLVAVDAADGRFRFAAAAAPAHGVAAPPETAPGAVFETRPEADALIARIAARVAAEGGAALIVDYGPAQGGPGDTLQAVRRHERTDPLEAPGNADLTAHVDFAALAHAAAGAGAAVHGPVAQGRFLIALGIELRLAALLATADADQAFALRSGCRRLIDPAQMGSLFKALALTHPALPAPPGFEGDRRC